MGGGWWTCQEHKIDEQHTAPLRAQSLGGATAISCHNDAARSHRHAIFTEEKIGTTFFYSHTDMKNIKI